MHYLGNKLCTVPCRQEAYMAPSSRGVNKYHKITEGVNRGCISPQISPLTLSRNEGDSALTLRKDGIVINFPGLENLQDLRSPYF